MHKTTVKLPSKSTWVVSVHRGAGRVVEGQQPMIIVHLWLILLSIVGYWHLALFWPVRFSSPAIEVEVRKLNDKIRAIRAEQDYQRVGPTQTLGGVSGNCILLYSKSSNRPISSSRFALFSLSFSLPCIRFVKSVFVIPVSRLTLVWCGGQLLKPLSYSSRVSINWVIWRDSSRARSWPKDRRIQNRSLESMEWNDW